MNVESLKYPATCIVGGALIVAGAWVLGPVSWALAGGTATSVGQFFMGDTLHRGWGGICDKAFRGDGALNHDLEKAFVKAFTNGTNALRRGCEQRAKQRPQTFDHDPVAHVKAVFDAWGKNARSLSTPQWRRQWSEDASHLSTYFSGLGTARLTLKSILEKELEQTEEWLRSFIIAEFANTIEKAFVEELKTDTKAWRAYGLVTNVELHKTVAAIEDNTTATAEAVAAIRIQLERWQETLERLEHDPGGPDPIRDAALAEALTQINTKLDVQLRRLIELGDHVTSEADRVIDEVVGAVGRRIEDLQLAPNQPSVPTGRVDCLQSAPPPTPSRFFKGRGPLLDRLWDQFRSGRNTSALVQTLHGQGGFGKTQVALAYARHRLTRGDYDGAVWVRAETIPEFQTDLTHLATSIGAITPEQAGKLGFEDVLRAIKRSLADRAVRGERWLIVFDNATSNDPTANDSTAPDIRTAIPSTETCDVLITSRESNWSDVAQLQLIRELEEGDAVSFLLARTGRDDTEGARRLAAELGYLPLALEQAGAYLAGRQLESFDDYRASLSLDRLGDLRNHLSGAYEESVATTWLRSLEAVRKQSPAGADLLTLCSFFAPDAIPLDTIIAHADALPASTTLLGEALRYPRTAADAVEAIGKYSLAEIGAGRLLFIHRLVQFVTREWLSDEEKRAWADAAVALLLAAFPPRPWEPERWPRAEPLAAHAAAAYEYRRGLANPTAEAAQLAGSLGLYLQGRAHYHPARQHQARALAIFEQVYGPDHPEVARTLTNLGTVERVLGHHETARQHQARALAIKEQVYGPDHPEVAITLTNLGIVLEVLGDRDDACDALSRATSIFERRLGTNHQYTQTAMRNAARACQNEVDT